ncbi:MAG: hypothetical protein HFI93_01510 [Lachnospiraceae bacterium]|nr:hypothetical protein [Lachnospiraceae bacterium]
MKTNKKLANAIRIFLVAGMILTAGITSASAYFTTYTEAEGGYPIALGDTTTIYETVSEWTKHLRITNQEGSEPVYVRARAYCGRMYSLSYESESEYWSKAPDEEGFYYYNKILEAGETAEELRIRITNPPQDASDSFNVIVIYESTPVQYDENGNPYMDWNLKLDSTVETGTDSGAGGDS